MAQTATTTIQPIPYLLFNGNCEEAMRFYESALGGKLTSVTRLNDTPMASHFPDGPNFVVNAQLELPGGGWLYAGDQAPHMGGYEGIKGMTVCLNLPDVSEAERIFNALSEGGAVSMPFSPSFWAKGFGMCDDKFGTPWMVNGELL
jgi:PhnB protein